MTTIWAHRLLASLLLVCIGLGAAHSRAADAPAAPAPPPVARVEPVTDSHFGEAVVDRYRWMENSRDRDWLPFLTGQNARTRAVLDALPGRTALLKRIRQLSGDAVGTGRVQRAGGRLFYQQRPVGTDNFKLFVREPGGNVARAGRDRLLVDPTALDTPGHHVSLDWWEASPDGRMLVYGLSKDGSEDSVLHVLNVDTGALLAERIADTQNADPHWLPDGSGFFYNQLTGRVDTPERFLDSRARFHRLNTDPAADPVLMARGMDPAVTYDRIQLPTVRVGARSGHALLVLSDVRPDVRVFIAPLAAVLAGKARWQPVAQFADEVSDIDLDGDVLHLLSTRGHPRGRVLRTSAIAPDLAGADQVVAESALVLEELVRAQDGLYLRAMDGGLGRLQRLAPDGALRTIALPFDGTLRQVEGAADAPGVLLQLTGWLQPAGIWAVDAGGRVRDTGLAPRPKIATAAYASERRFAVAKDGTRIPYDLVYRRGLRHDGSAPAFVSAYGSYGAPGYTPAFAGRSLALIDQGAVVGYAAVRGGGEYGRDWHRAGQLENKPNTWRDLIAVAEDMVANGYTAPARLAIGGRSAGGITVGQAMNERPELFAAVVAGVGWHNPLRYVAEQNGYGEEPEWGAIADPAGYRALKSIDSYQAVTDGVRYPAVLLTTGVTDPRVAPFHVGKMAARLQAATASDPRDRPVLLRVDFDAGHGMGSTRAQHDAEAADTYAFILWQTRGARSAR